MLLELFSVCACAKEIATIALKDTASKANMIIFLEFMFQSSSLLLATSPDTNWNSRRSCYLELFGCGTCDIARDADVT